MTRFLFWLLLAVAAGLAGSALVAYLRPEPDGPAFAVADPERDLGSRPIGEFPLSFVVTNRSDVPRRIIGVAEG